MPQADPIHVAIENPETRARMLACARRMLQNGADAEDCVQEALLIATQRAFQFEMRASPLAWLCRIVENVCRMWRRAQRRICRGGEINFVQFEEDSSGFLGLPANDPERTLVGKQSLAVVSGELSTMQRAHADVFCRLVIDEESLRTIAREHQLTRQALKSRVFRVRLALRERLPELRAAGE